MIESDPTGRLDVVNVATPLAFNDAGEPSVVLPFLNVTVPVGVPVPEAGLTVAVKVTAWPLCEGLGEEVSEVVVLIRLLTVWVNGDEVLFR